MAVLFFDIGSTLANVIRLADGTLTFTPLQRVVQSLDALSGFRKGIISNPGGGTAARGEAVAALAASFGAWFDEPTLIHWGAKDQRAIFDAAAASASERPENCVFIGEDALERRIAHEAGMRTAPHPVFALAAVEQRPVFWAKVTLPTGVTLAELALVIQDAELVPLHVPSPQLVLAIATERAVSVLQQAGFTVDLRGDAAIASAYLMRDDRPLPTIAGFNSLSAEEQTDLNASLRATAAFAYVSRQTQGFTAAVTSLGAAPGGVYLAAEPGTQVEEIHIPGARHGHTERLLPDPSLLEPPGSSRAVNFDAAFSPAIPSSDLLSAVESVITSELMRSYIAKLSGAEPLGAENDLRVSSRHIDNAGNALAVEFIKKQFAEVGLLVRLQEFSYRGTWLRNIEAEYNVPGEDGIVLITAHLDSTASFGHFEDADGHQRDYAPAIDPAPGADDNASGVAAVLGAAQCLRRLLDVGKVPSRSIRFVLFNAEEQGLLGSKSYARAAAQTGDRIAGVLQMDMIGGFQGGKRKMEIHAGCAVPGPASEASNQLADRVAQAVEAVASSSMIIQRSTGPTDPAAGRSDHASFHERGWAAIAVSENFFPDTEPATGTEQYHMPGDILADKAMNTDYAAAVARSVACAGLALAGL